MNSLFLNPTGDFLLELVLKGALIMSIAFAITFVFKKASAALRHAVWSLGFAGLLVLPFCTALLPTWQVPIPEWATPMQLVSGHADASVSGLSTTQAPGDAVAAHVNAADVADQSVRTSVQVEPMSTTAPVESMNTTAPVESMNSTAPVASMNSTAHVGSTVATIATGSASSGFTSSSWTWARVALLVWMTGAIALLIRLSLVLGKLSVLRRRADSVDNPRWKERAASIASMLEIGRPIRLLQHAEIVVPMTYGVRRPVIFLPVHASHWSDDEVNVTLMHELLHVKRYDHLVHILALFARALHWFNPLTWAATKQLVIERERACDDGVLSMGVASTSYADHLLGIARDVLSGREASTAALAMARPSELRTRIVAILDPALPRRTMTRLRMVAMTGSATLLVVLLAAMQPAQPKSTDGLAIPEVPEQDGSVSIAVRADQSDYLASHWAELRPENDQIGALKAFAQLPSDEQDRSGESGRSGENVRSDENAEFDENDGSDGNDGSDENAGSGERDGLAGSIRSKVTEWLSGQSADTTEVETQRKALFAISQLPRERSVPFLTEVARTHSNPALREEAVFWLGQVGGESVADLLESFARDDDNVDVQKKAVFALSEMDDGEGMSRLMNLARTHSSNELRADAVFWLGQEGGADVADVLVTFARSDTSPEVQKKAIFALAELDDQVGVPHLIDLAKTHSDPELRSDAIFWLGETGDPRAADVLMEIVNGN